MAVRDMPKEPTGTGPEYYQQWREYAAAHSNVSGRELTELTREYIQEYKQSGGATIPEEPVNNLPDDDPNDGPKNTDPGQPGDPNRPGQAWIWNGSSWVRPAKPNDGKPYIWSDSSGWQLDTATMSNRQSAFETIEGWFQYFGIDDLVPGAEQSLSSLIRQWTSQDKSIDWIKLEIRKTAQYKARFPGMEALAKEGLAISEAEYIANERAYTQVLQASGMPKSFYDDRQDFANFMVAQVSPQELASRVQIAKDYVNLYAPPTVKQQLRELYGMTDDQMAAYVLDTSENKMRSLAALEAEYTKKMSQAEVGGAAATVGIGLGRTLRDQIAESGFDYRQSVSGLTGVQTQADAYRRLGQLYNQETSTDELVQETFGLTGGTEATKKKRKLASRERAAFGGTSALSQGSLGSERMGQV